MPNTPGRTLANGTIEVGNASGVAVAVTPSGDVTFTNAGVAAIGAGKVTNTMLAGSIAATNIAKPRIRCITETVTRASMTDGGGTSGTKVLTASIPAGALYLHTLVTAITGFTGDTSATFTLGDGSDVDRYNTGTPSCFTTASQGVSVGAASGTAWHTSAVTPTLTVTSNADFTNVAAGSMDITLVFSEPI